MILPAPHVEYFLLAPMLIVFSVAVAGCLPRPMSWSPTGSPRPNCWPSCRRT